MRRRSLLLPTLTVALTLVASSGCSAIGVRGPRTSPTTHEVVCDATYVPPVIDAAIAITGAALIAWNATSDSDPEGHSVSGRDFAAIPGALMLIGFGLSAVVGFPKVSSCKAAASSASTTARAP